MAVARYDRNALAPIILERLAEGDSLTHICKTDEALPAPSTFLLWVSQDDDLAERYAHARVTGIEKEFDEIKEISDSVKGWNTAAIQKARLMVDVRKWRLAKMMPQKYGKVQANTQVNVAVQTNIEQFPPEPEP